MPDGHSHCNYTLHLYELLRNVFLNALYVVPGNHNVGKDILLPHELILYEDKDIFYLLLYGYTDCKGTWYPHELSLYAFSNHLSIQPESYNQYI